MDNTPECPSHGAGCADRTDLGNGLGEADRRQHAPVSIGKRCALFWRKVFVKEGLIYSVREMCYGERSTELEACPMPHQTFAEVTFEQYGKSTRRERFLDEMNRVVPWANLVAAIEPVYPRADGPGRPPVGIERMLRLHWVQQWFNLSDPAVEEALYDSRAMRQFVGIALGREPVPDETTICKFRPLLEAHELGKQLFVRIGEY